MKTSLTPDVGITSYKVKEQMFGLINVLIAFSFYIKILPPYFVEISRKILIPTSRNIRDVFLGPGRISIAAMHNQQFATSEFFSEPQSCVFKNNILI